MLITRKETIKKSTNRYIKSVEISLGLIKNSITGFKISQQPVHDIPHAEKILVQRHRTRKSDTYVLDKDTILKIFID